MSISVVAVPVSIQILSAIAPIALSALNAGYDYFSQNSNRIFVEENTNVDNLPNIYDKECEVQYIKETNFLEKAFQTPFVDKDLLIKTLEEHGVSVQIEDYGKIVGIVSSYTLTFTKNNDNEPYNVVISHLEQDNAEEKLQDISTEYSQNVQEKSYLDIIEKLKENNMELESEEVLEDNTIVLTVNLE